MVSTVKPAGMDSNEPCRPKLIGNGALPLLSITTLLTMKALKAEITMDSLASALKMTIGALPLLPVPTPSVMLSHWPACALAPVMSPVNDT